METVAVAVTVTMNMTHNSCGVVDSVGQECFVV